MTNDKNTEQVAFEADKDLIEAFRIAKKEGRRYLNNKRFSNRLAYEIGIKMLLGYNEEEEEEVFNQALEEIQIQKSLLDLKEKHALEGREKARARKQKETEELQKIDETAQSLAARLKQDWKAIKVLRKSEHIGFIATNFEKFGVTKASLEKVFAAHGKEAPEDAELLIIASDLIGA